VDLVLLFDVLAHVKYADSQALFQRLFTQQLVPNGIVIIITEIYCPTSGLMLIMERLGKPIEVDYADAEKEMLAAGFTLVYSQDFTEPVDYSNPSDDLVKFFQLLARNEVSEEEVRAAINDVAGPNTQMDLSKKMGIKKPSHYSYHGRPNLRTKSLSLDSFFSHFRFGSLVFGIGVVFCRHE